MTPTVNACILQMSKLRLSEISEKSTTLKKYEGNKKFILCLDSIGEKLNKDIKNKPKAMYTRGQTTIQVDEAKDIFSIVLIKSRIDF